MACNETSVDNQLSSRMNVITLATASTADAQAVSEEAFPFFNLPIEIQLMVLDKLYVKPWTMTLFSTNNYPILNQTSLCSVPLVIPELRKLVAEVFDKKAILKKNISGTLSLLDDTFNCLTLDYDIAHMIHAVSNAVTGINLGKSWRVRAGTDDLQKLFPNLTTIHIQGNEFIKNYWRDNGPVFARGDFKFGHLITGWYDGHLISFMQLALDALMPPSRCKTKDIEVGVTLGIRGNYLQAFGGWSTRLGTADVVAIDFVRRGTKLRIARKWFYTTSTDLRKTLLITRPFPSWAPAHFGELGVDMRVRSSSEDPMELIVLD